MTVVAEVLQKYGKINVGYEKGMYWVRLGNAEKLYSNSIVSIFSVLSKY